MFDAKDSNYQKFLQFTMEYKGHVTILHNNHYKKQKSSF